MTVFEPTLASVKDQSHPEWMTQDHTYMALFIAVLLLRTLFSSKYTSQGLLSTSLFVDLLLPAACPNNTMTVLFSQLHCTAHLSHSPEA